MNRAVEIEVAARSPPGQPWALPVRSRQAALDVFDRFARPDFDGAETYLPFGNGRSYGDSCLNEGGTVICTRYLDRLIAFDPITGMVCCEAGTLLSEILALVMPHGWFPQVTPGTRFVTVGGAIANDVHGKNHHRVGSFGCHVEAFELLRSDGSAIVCSASQNAEMFRATIGGLGLTGLIRWASFRLKRAPNPHIRGSSQLFSSLDEFLARTLDSDSRYEYSVAWVDCLSKGGRGILSFGNHAEQDDRSPPRRPRRSRWHLNPPFALINGPVVRAFNALYYGWHSRRSGVAHWHFEKFFYPLDALLNWNRVYGRRGFFQHQCVVPTEDSARVLGEMLRIVRTARQGSMLTVLKVFGERQSGGVLSFPRPGVTMAVDFANVGNRTLRLLGELDNLAVAAGGAVYPAKDARMSADCFQRSFPRWREFSGYVDPRFSSSFWRRVTS